MENWITFALRTFRNNTGLVIILVAVVVGFGAVATFRLGLRQLMMFAFGCELVWSSLLILYGIGLVFAWLFYPHIYLVGYFGFVIFLLLKFGIDIRASTRIVQIGYHIAYEMRSGNFQQFFGTYIRGFRVEYGRNFYLGVTIVHLGTYLLFWTIWGYVWALCHGPFFLVLVYHIFMRPITVLFANGCYLAMVGLYFIAPQSTLAWLLSHLLGIGGNSFAHLMSLGLGICIFYMYGPFPPVVSITIKALKALLIDAGPRNPPSQ